MRLRSELHYNRMKTKYTSNYGMQIVGMAFQTDSIWLIIIIISVNTQMITHEFLKAIHLDPERTSFSFLYNHPNVPVLFLSPLH